MKLNKYTLLADLPIIIIIVVLVIFSFYKGGIMGLFAIVVGAISFILVVWWIKFWVEKEFQHNHLKKEEHY